MARGVSVAAVRLGDMASIAIKFTDGSSVHYPDITGAQVKDQILIVAVGVGEVIHFSPNHWASYIQNPTVKNPVALLH